MGEASGLGGLLGGLGVGEGLEADGRRVDGAYLLGGVVASLLNGGDVEGQVVGGAVVLAERDARLGGVVPGEVAVLRLCHRSVLSVARVAASMIAALSHFLPCDLSHFGQAGRVSAARPAVMFSSG